MRIDLHIHSKNGSDGKWDIVDIFKEASKRSIDVISITDHDSIDAQKRAMALAGKYSIRYITGVELNVSLSHPRYQNGKPASLDFLGYGFNIEDHALADKLKSMRDHRVKRAEQILAKINIEFGKQGLREFTDKDLEGIRETVDGSFGRPHIADYMIKKGIVSTKQEAFDRYLVNCDVPKLPLGMEEASALIHGAGGRLMLAHPNDPNGTSLRAFTKSIPEQHEIIRDIIRPHIDGIECWHSRHDKETIKSYIAFSHAMDFMVTGGSDCHQQPVLMGTIEVPDYVIEQFDL